ncbi:MAG: tRNA (adenosine(37)-N6)-dimethylallyltransferase MiaA [Anaerolineae bacterium]|nr:tRNA (adenosine(37)-N6)-dimethylallyltransferase MiaA [Anaerolineae bacterium]
MPWRGNRPSGVYWSALPQAGATQQEPAPAPEPEPEAQAERRPLVVISGPTASGKTGLGIALAQRFGGEIVSADSRQIYRRMDIGTAKPAPADRAAVPHHLLDVVDPDQPFTLAEYQRAAYAAIDDIHARGGLPLLVGGTGQYLSAVTEGWGIPEVPPNPALRAELEAYARERGAAALHARLQQHDPEAAARIDFRNVRRVVRALEVCLETGTPISALQRKTPPPYRLCQIGLTLPRPALHERINRRVTAMIDAGLADEVRALLETGYTWDLPSMSGLGYAQWQPYFAGEQSLAATIDGIRQATRAFARRQMTWFKGHDTGILWLDVAQVEPGAEAARLVEDWILHEG